MRTRLTVLLVLCATLPSSCGGSDTTDLAITVKNALGEHPYSLQCDPPVGDVPRPSEACAVIARNAAAMLFPRDLGVTCAGGLYTPYIHVNGRYRGKTVDTVVSACGGHYDAEALWLKLLPALPR